MTAELWLQLILVGGIAGAAGQTARAIVGLKKLIDDANATNTSPLQQFVPARLIVSLLIGFVAGVLAAVTMDTNQATNLQTASIVAFAAAGYMGTDFIEGIIGRFLPGSSVPTAAGGERNQSSASLPGKPGDYQG
jgi:uncharacterized membrane protein YeaQ/YmgE (transglycosylase-associated protein family)